MSFGTIFKQAFIPALLVNTGLFMLLYDGSLLSMNFVDLKPDVFGHQYDAKPLFASEDKAPIPYPGDKEALIAYLERERKFTQEVTTTGADAMRMREKAEENLLQQKKEIAAHLVSVGAYKSIQDALGDRGWRKSARQ